MEKGIVRALLSTILHLSYPDHRQLHLADNHKPLNECIVICSLWYCMPEDRKGNIMDILDLASLQKPSIVNQFPYCVYFEAIKAMLASLSYSDLDPQNNTYHIE